jgi:hypothetical protein
MLWAAPTERSFKSEAATDMVTAIWGAAVVVIITDGVEAEGIITAGGIIATDFNLLEAASVGGLFDSKRERNVACWHFWDMPSGSENICLSGCIALATRLPAIRPDGCRLTFRRIL